MENYKDLTVQELYQELGSIEYNLVAYKSAIDQLESLKQNILVQIQNKVHAASEASETSSTSVDTD